MRLLRPVGEDEVIALFLRGELGSSRFRETLAGKLARDGRDEAVLLRPDLEEAGENDYRRGLLDEHRGYEERIGLFLDFPAQVDWFRAELEPDEVLDILFIDWSWWLMLSDGSRQPRDAARKIHAGDLDGILADVTAEEHEPLAAALRANPRPPELIAATTPALAPLVLVDGHFRLTAYALFPEYLGPTLEILLGVSEDMAGWCQF